MFNNLLFIIKTCFIVCSELCIYLFTRDYTKLMDGITHRFASVNILYVKFFQAIALNNDLIDDKINNKLIKFTDNAPWNYDDIRRIELGELMKEYDLKFKENYKYPINSGMISLVFLAYNSNTGEPVIIKMKRNNIDNKLNEAIENLNFIIYILSFIPILNNYSIPEVINKNINIIKQQTNFSIEIDNMIRCKKCFKNIKYIKIPEVMTDSINKYPNFIVMEYINGIKINEIKEEDKNMFSKQLLKFGLISPLVHGFMHGDLHAGNLLFIKDETDLKYKHKVGVLDFGIIYDYDDNYKNILFELVSTLFTDDIRNITIRMVNFGIFEPLGVIETLSKKEYDLIVNILEEIIIDATRNSKVDIYKIMTDLHIILNKEEVYNLGLRVNDNVIKIVSMLSMLHGVIFTLCKDDFSLFFENVVKELFHTNLLM